jgi:tetratricopeptide (TPR) repeat protein
LAERVLALGDGAAALHIADEIVALDGNLAVAYQLRAASLIQRADEDAEPARNAYLKCLQISPRATSCLRDLADLDLYDGQCEQAEHYIRDLIADDPKISGSYLRLAEALFGQHSNAAEARTGLDLFLSAAPAATRERDRIATNALLSALQGHFDEAKHSLLEWRREIAGDPDELQHERVDRFLLLLLTEIGDVDSVRAVANDFLEQSKAWTPSNYFPDTRIEAMSALYAIGDVSRDQFSSYRDQWAQDMSRKVRTTPAIRWVMGWAEPAKDHEDGIKALEALPAAYPYEELLRRDAISEDAIGSSFLLAGRIDLAIDHLSRGARSCTALRSPMQNTHAHLRLGIAYEKREQQALACREYAVVLDRWGADPRSVSVITARQHASDAHCQYGQN